MNRATNVDLEAAHGLWVFFEKCARLDEVDDWSLWRHGPRVHALRSAGASSVVCAEVTPRPAPGMPGVGFTHVCLARFASQPEHSPDELNTVMRERGCMHPAHAAIDVETFVAHGLHPAPAMPSRRLTGHILTFVMPNDPADLDGWDRWYDEQHLPDMMASGAFDAGSRWLRSTPRPIGPNHLTLYDITTARVEDAVDISAAAMPGLIAAGRKRRSHVGGLTVVMRVEHLSTSTKVAT